VAKITGGYFGNHGHYAEKVENKSEINAERENRASDKCKARHLRLTSQ